MVTGSVGPRIYFYDWHDYKYQLARDYCIDLPYQYNLLDVEETVDTGYIKLDPDGQLVIRKGYAWDGASGPTCDTQDTYRASLVHDALYQLIRLGHLKPEARGQADSFMRQLLKEDGMPLWRVWYWYNGLRLGGGSAAKPRKVEGPVERCAP